MSVNALPAQGIVVKLGSGSPLTYTAIKEVVSFNGPGGKGQIIDVTDLSSTAAEKQVGLYDEGQLSFDINYIPGDTQHDALRAALASGAKVQVKIVFPDTGTTEWTFDAFVTGFAISGGVNATVKAAVTVEITGAVTAA